MGSWLKGAARGSSSSKARGSDVFADKDLKKLKCDHGLKGAAARGLQLFKTRESVDFADEDLKKLKWDQRLRAGCSPPGKVIET